jgi:hypothetical protein
LPKKLLILIWVWERAMASVHNLVFVHSPLFQLFNGTTGAEAEAL